MVKCNEFLEINQKNTARNHSKSNLALEIACCHCIYITKYTKMNSLHGHTKNRTQTKRLKIVVDPKNKIIKLK